MKRCIMTCCTSDYYQYYIPVFVWSVLNTWDDVDIKIFLRGELNQNVKDAICIIGKSYPGQNRFDIEQWYKTDYPYQIGTTNALRFTTEKLDYDQVLVTDIDFFFTEMPRDLFQWHDEIKDNDCFVGQHGPWYRPPRPKICESWHGDFQRVAGGFFITYPKWWERTKDQREMWDKKLKSGEWGHFRESDEVMLYRMIGDVGLPIPNKVPFPRFLRHLHFGDFKPEMRTRFEDEQKMSRLLDPRVVNAFLRALNDKTFSKILSIVRKDAQVDDIMGRTIKYCRMSKYN